MGFPTKYPAPEELHEFLTARVRAHKRLEAAFLSKSSTTNQAQQQYRCDNSHAHFATIYGSVLTTQPPTTKLTLTD